MKLDLGCGSRRRAGFVGVDASADTEADLVWDLRRTPWPYGDETIEEANCSHFLEHLTGAERLPFMDELWRVMAPGAKATFIVPHWTSTRSVMDPTHQWPPLCAESFLYFNRSWRIREKLHHYPIRCNFTFDFYHCNDPGVGLGDLEFVAKHYNNVIDDLVAVLTRHGATEETPC